MKKEKNKVGRPKLADKKLLKESILYVSILGIILVVFVFCGYNILSIQSGKKLDSRIIYNDHVNSCVVRNDTLDCGPNVEYLKYTIDGKETEMHKEDGCINVKLNGKKVNAVYQMFNSDILSLVK